MAGRRISLSKGRGKLGHNNRDFLTPNVDKDRVKNNIIIKQQDIGVAYEQIFGEARKAYNAKQTRKSRQIEDYYEKLFGKPTDEIVKGGNRNSQYSFYEFVIGIGDKNDTGFATNPEMAAVAVECLKEYYYGNPEHGVKSFEERNPNFHLLNGVIHCDEATPHGHTDFIPYSDGYEKGMTRQQGIARALEKMGYGADKQSINRWRKAERQVLREICERHGIEVAEEQKGRGVTLTTEEYKEYAERQKQNAELKAENQKLQKENDELTYTNEMLNGINDTVKQEIEDNLDKLNEAKKSICDLNEQKDQLILERTSIPPRPQLPPPLPPDETRPMREHRPYTREEERELAKLQKAYDKSHAKGGERWKMEQEHAAKTEQKSVNRQNGISNTNPLLLQKREWQK